MQHSKQRLFEMLIRPLPRVPSVFPIYKTTLTDTANANSSTFNAVDIGVPHPKRLIVLAVFHGVAAACTATINNTNMHRIQNTAHEFAIFHLQVPVGTTADIVVTATSSIRKAVSVYVAYPNNPIPLDSATATANTTTNANAADQKVQANGFLIYSGGQLATLGTFTTTWNGTDAVVEDVDAQLEAASSYTAGHINITNSTDVSDLDMAESTSGTKRLVVGTWGPPPGY